MIQVVVIKLDDQKSKHLTKMPTVNSFPLLDWKDLSKKCEASFLN